MSSFRSAVLCGPEVVKKSQVIQAVGSKSGLYGIPSHNVICIYNMVLRHCLTMDPVHLDRVDWYGCCPIRCSVRIGGSDKVSDSVSCGNKTYSAKAAARAVMVFILVLIAPSAFGCGSSPSLRSLSFVCTVLLSF